MKRTLQLIAVALIAAAVSAPIFAAGSQEKSAPKSVGVFLLISGSLGDKGFNDSAKAGLDMIKAKYGDKVSVKYTELGADTAKYAPALEDAGAEKYAVVLCSNNFRSALKEIAPRYPGTLYIMYDGWVEGDVPNVYSIQYRNSEAGFLAGTLAGKITAIKGDGKINEENVVGFIGGRDITGINDFLVGYITGAKMANSNVKVIYNYVNSFTDTAKAKDQALIQIGQYKADVVYHAAGRAGLGLFDAAAETGKYAIGVDTDQASLFGNEPAKSTLILTSTMKRVDLSLSNSFDKFFGGEKLGGQKVWMGIAEGAIGYAPFNAAIPKEVQADLDKVSADVKAGKVKIPSAFALSADEITKLRESVNAAKN